MKIAQRFIAGIGSGPRLEILQPFIPAVNCLATITRPLARTKEASLLWNVSWTLSEKCCRYGSSLTFADLANRIRDQTISIRDKHQREHFIGNESFIEFA